MSKPKIQTEALVKSHWNEEAKAKAELAIDFVQLLMNEHDFDAVLERFEDKYTQHNRTISDGLHGVIETIGKLIKNAPEFSYDVKHVFVDGDFVILHSHATLKAKHRGDDTKGLNIIDTWCIEDGRLVEHWDAVQGLDVSMRLYGLFTGGTIRNTNGVF